MAHNDEARGSWVEREAGGSDQGGDAECDPLTEHYMSMQGNCSEDDMAMPRKRTADEREDAEGNKGTVDDATYYSTDDPRDGNETTTSGAADGHETTDAGSSAKRRRKERKPNRLPATRSTFAEVDPTGLPLLPRKLAGGFGNNCGCILRDTAKIYDANIRDKNHEELAGLLIQKLHARYKFPPDYRSLDLYTNPVNSYALGKMSRALSTWKNRVRAKIDEGCSFEDIHRSFPPLSMRI